MCSAEVEALVGHPSGRLRAAAQPARQRGREPDPLADALAQALDVHRRRLAGAEPHDLAGVPGDRAALQVEDRAILGAEWNRLLHTASILAYAAAAGDGQSTP